MNTYDDILEISKKLKMGSVNFNEVPFGAILEESQKIYAQFGDDKCYFTSMYGELLVNAVKAQNRETASLVLELLANHIMVLNTGLDSIIVAYNNKLFEMKTEINNMINREKIILHNETHTPTDIVPFEGRGVIYSAITGGYDDVKIPKVINPNFDYILFTDNDAIQSDFWEIRKIDNQEGLDKVRLARKVKILGHEYLPEYDYSIWVDGKIQIVGNVEEYIKSYRRKEPMLCFGHYINDCIYDEKELCLKVKKDTPEIMEKQMDKYRKEGYPKKNGLIDSCVLVRDWRSDKLKKVMNIWWNEVKMYSCRDQLSFNYACWKEDFMYDTSILCALKNDYFATLEHNPESENVSSEVA